MRSFQLLPRGSGDSSDQKDPRVLWKIIFPFRT